MLKKAVNKRHRAVLSAFLLPAILVALILTTACSQKGGASASEDHSVYEGNGTLVTRVNVAIQSGDKLLYVGTVRVIDDKPTVWKALMGINGNDKLDINIEKSADGQIVGVQKLKEDEMEEEQKGKRTEEQKDKQQREQQWGVQSDEWILSLENQRVEAPYDVEDIEVKSGIGVTLYEEKK